MVLRFFKKGGVDMWLPTKEERDLLAYYYKTIKKPNELYVFDPWLDPNELSDAVGHFRRIRRIFREVKYWLRSKVFKCPKVDHEPRWEKEWAANERLHERKFIELGKREKRKVPIKLSLQGWDLGRKYSNPLIRSGLWFAEYKHHWFWLIVAYIGGILSALVVNWFSKQPI
jgi:hypothetical protein